MMKHNMNNNKKDDEKNYYISFILLTLFVYLWLTIILYILIS